ncbi:RING-H2 finger protein ATL7-like [Primulina tabacum]|uniref:RING-H2 finger protein ATL7-like n=1 Tax=Primulina tabacum TaxID=48773 RepID=UPI003F5A5206
MAYQLPKFTNALSLLKKLYRQDHRGPATYVFGQNSPGFCSICLNDICRGDTHRRLPRCMHSFHSGCIDAWFESRSTCPLCRIEVPDQFISLSENRNDFLSDFASNFVSLVQNFFEKIVDPDIDEAISLLMYGDIRTGF